MRLGGSAVGTMLSELRLPPKPPDPTTKMDHCALMTFSFCSSTTSTEEQSHAKKETGESDVTISDNHSARLLIQNVRNAHAGLKNSAGGNVFMELDVLFSVQDLSTYLSIDIVTD